MRSVEEIQEIHGARNEGSRVKLGQIAAGMVFIGSGHIKLCERTRR